MSKEYIFNIDRRDHLYKGVLFADGDVKELFKDSPFPPLSNWHFGIMGIIWVDELGIWHGKMRFKYPSGNKMIADIESEKDANETKMLQKFYQFPMINKHWYPNPSGSIEGISEILQKSDMLETFRVIQT